jgi:hypothetical protein
MEARMPRALLVLTLTLTFVLPAVVRAQDPNVKQLATRVELHAIPSLTLSDAQFLTGDTSGKPVTVNGELRIAQGSGRLPVAVLVHGSGGPGANVDLWVRQLNALGISTFMLDGSWTPIARSSSSPGTPASIRSASS